MTWLFDLDNTLYPFTSGMYEHINHRMNQFIKNKLQISLPQVDHLRKKYVSLYGTTLLGMMIHHDTNPEEFLKDIHSFSIFSFLKKEPELFQFIEKLKGKKYIFTNSPCFYAKKVLSVLSVESLFVDIFSIETFHYQGKPSKKAFEKVCGYLPKNETIYFIDDEPSNIEMAKKFKFFTVLVDSRRTDIDNYYRDELFPKLKGME